MTSAAPDLYAFTLSSSGKLKLRAKALLCEDDPEATFRASVLLHEAARLEARALKTLATSSPATRLRSAIEVCGCLVDALDPPRAADAWGDVLRAREEVDGATATAMLSKLAPRYEALHDAFVRAIAESPTLRSARDAGAMTALRPSERATARKEVAAALEQFPGTASFWWMSYRLAEADEDKAGAWEALERARELAPENARFLAMSLLVAAWALPVAKADAHLQAIRPSLERRSAEVCLMYALAEITLARKTNPGGRRARWERARHAADAGVSRATTELRKKLRAVQLLVGALLEGREPTLDILYLAGLTKLASSARAKTDVVELLTTELRKAA